MNKNLLLALGLGVALSSSAQVGLNGKNYANVNSRVQKNFSNYHNFGTPKSGEFTPKAGVDTVKYYDLSDQTGWVIDNDGQTGADYGWAFTTTRRSWSGAIPSPFNSSSQGQYLEVKNGNPTLSPATQALNVTYTVTSPVINITTNEVSLRYQQVGARFNDLQQVLISIDNGNSWQAVDDNLDKAVLSAGGGAAYANPTVENVNLSTAVPAGTTQIMVRFLWTTNIPASATNPNVWVTYGWGIDDVMIYNNPQFDLKYVDAQAATDFDFSTSPGFVGPKYSMIPTTQQQDVKIAQYLTNNGFGTLTNVKSNFDLTTPSGTTNIVATGSASVTKGLGDTIIHTINITTEGDYSANNFAAYSDESDEDSTNNISNFSWKTHFGGDIYAMDDDSVDGVDFGDNGLYLTGNEFDILNNVDATGIDVYIATNNTYQSTVGMPIYATIFDFTQATPTEIDRSDDYILSASDNNKWITIPFSAPVSLTNNTAYFAGIGSAGSGAPTATSNDFVIGTSGVSNKQTSFLYYGSEDTWYYTTTTPMVRLNFTPGLATKTLDNSLKVNVYPNPAKNKIVVDYNTAFNGDVNISIVDLSGRTVYNQTVANQVAGNNKVELNVNNMNAGVYQVVISSNSSSVTKKLVIK